MEYICKQNVEANIKLFLDTKVKITNGSKPKLFSSSLGPNKLERLSLEVNRTPGTVFTTLYSICNLQLGSISSSVRLH
jgi:hypothetical protein